MSAYRGPLGSCQRCGFTYPLSQLKKEWTGLRVCPEDFDPRPAETKAPRYKPEGLILPNASPEPEPVFGRIQWNPTPVPVPSDFDLAAFLLLMDSFSL